MDLSKPWKKGALSGALIWLLVVLFTGLVKGSMAFIVVLFAPDFVIIGALVGYLYGRFVQKV